MANYLITYSPVKNYGFENNLYVLSEEQNVDIQDIEKYTSAAVLIPYDYKNVIEPTCFPKNKNQLYPIILPVIIQKSFRNLSELKSFIFYNSKKPKNLNTSFEYVSFDEYKKNYETIQEYLKKGDIYEMNYCIPFIFRNIELNPYDLFFKLARKMQSPFTALFKYNHMFILSFSPERFLKKTNSALYTEPIKGTAPRGKTKEEDKKNIHKLLHSKKERTENAMIVDVCRNDLSKIAQKGTVNVDELFAIKSYPTVHQMVSTVSCRLKSNISFKDIIYATFPMASMTGAPKIRAMQIAEELEKYPREYYSGCLGIWQNQHFDLSVLIRSVFYDTAKKELKIWAGSAITIYTNPKKEYKECLLKAQKIIQSIKKYIPSEKV